MANELVHELLKLSDLIGTTRDGAWIEPIVLRLSRFFSYAYIKDVEIKCVSD